MRQTFKRKKTDIDWAAVQGILREWYRPLADELDRLLSDVKYSKLRYKVTVPIPGEYKGTGNVRVWIPYDGDDRKTLIDFGSCRLAKFTEDELILMGEFIAEAMSIIDGVSYGLGSKYKESNDDGYNGFGGFVLYWFRPSELPNLKEVVV